MHAIHIQEMWSHRTNQSYPLQKMVVRVQLHNFAVLPSAKESSVTIVQDAGLASGSVWPL